MHHNKKFYVSLYVIYTEFLLGEHLETERQNRMAFRGLFDDEVEEKELELRERFHTVRRILHGIQKVNLISLNIRGFFRSLASNTLLRKVCIRRINQLYSCLNM